MNNCHSKEIKGVLRELNVSEKCLSEEEARKRLQRHGKNTLKKKEGISALDIFLDQWRDFFVILLVIAALIEIGLGFYEGEIYDFLGGFLIIIIVLFIVLLGFYQEYSAEKALGALKKMLSPEAIVLREGEQKRILAEELVPGDIIKIESGSRIPADARILKRIDLKVDEAALTGESLPVKKVEKVLKEGIIISDRNNMLFMGTTATYGRGTAVVTETGMTTELGKIAEEVQTMEKEQTPLQRKMNELGKNVGLIVIGICFMIFLSLLATRWENLGVDIILDMGVIAVALAVAAVPEALPGVVTIGLSLGTRRMAEKNALVRKLPAVETLGCTTVICSDKTGTLTKNEMTVRDIYLSGREIEVTGKGYEPKGKFRGKYQEKDLELLLRIGVLCNNSSLHESEGKWEIVGDATEGCLIVLGEKKGMSNREMEREFPRKKEIPFTSERKMMTTIHQESDSSLKAYCKGASEIILERCSKIYEEGKVKKLTLEKKKEILDKNKEFGEKA